MRRSWQRPLLVTIIRTIIGSEKQELWIEIGEIRFPSIPRLSLNPVIETRADLAVREALAVGHF